MNKYNVIPGKFPQHNEVQAYIKDEQQRPAGAKSTWVMWVWVCIVLIWKPLRLFIAGACAFQFFKMVYFWHTSDIALGIQATIVFLLHFLVLSALTYFVSVYKPNGLDVK
jgi:hypothetical protein